MQNRSTYDLQGIEVDLYLDYSVRNIGIVANPKLVQDTSIAILIIEKAVIIDHKGKLAQLFTRFQVPSRAGVWSLQDLVIGVRRVLIASGLITNSQG